MKFLNLTLISGQTALINFTHVAAVVEERKQYAELAMVLTVSGVCYSVKESQKDIFLQMEAQANA